MSFLVMVCLVESAVTKALKYFNEIVLFACENHELVFYFLYFHFCGSGTIHLSPPNTGWRLLATTL